MTDFSQLINTGFHVTGKDSSQSGASARTVLIFGVPRSGTSIISGALHHLGVFNGERSFDPIYEDKILHEAILSGSRDKVGKVIENYNRQNDVWFYKHPDLLSDSLSFGASGRIAGVMNRLYGKDRFLPLSNFLRLYRMFRNPMCIITFKDIFAIANRNRLSMESDLLENMEDVMRTYRKIVVLLKQLDPHALLVSSEKIVNNKDLFLDKLIEFCQINPAPEQRQKALHFISAKPVAYLKHARVDSTIGYLDEVTNTCISGWARYVDHDKAAKVVLIIDGKEVETVSANLFREDLLANKLHPSGACSFRFTRFNPDLLYPGCEVRVKIANDVHDLNGSPFIS